MLDKKKINEKKYLLCTFGNIFSLEQAINELKEILKQNLTSDLAPLLIEQIKLLETSIKKQNLKDMNLANKKVEEFIYKNIEEPKLKAAEEKRLAEEKAHQEYLKSPEGKKFNYAFGIFFQHNLLQFLQKLLQFLHHVA